MDFFVKRSFHRSLALCIPAVLGLTVLGGGAAHAGIFHHKDKPLSQKDDALASVSSNQPDKELFDRSMKALKKGKFDIARLDLQTLLNTYPDSEYAMRAKLAIGDTWYKEGGTAALTQAEEEYKDFITFFPDKPEAAEAQMKVADIYYKQMQKPDRDPTNAVRAQEEYRAMILQYPDSSLVPQAKQHLREVQEVLGEHEFAIGAFYQTQMNYGGSIARLQSIIDTYPLFSRTDEALLDVGDAYAAQARNAAKLRLDPAAKARLVKLYTRRAAQSYDRVILEYPMTAHVDDARDRLEGLGLPVPEPNQQQLADSSAIEQSRAPVNLKYKAVILITARPSVVQAARVGEPSLTDPMQIMAPAVVKQTMSDVQWAVKPDGKTPPSLPGTSNNVRALGTLAGNNATAPTGTGAASGESGAAATNALEMHDVSGDNDVSGSVVNSNGADTGSGPGAPMNAVQPPAGSGPGSVAPAQPATESTPDTTGQPTVWPSATNDSGGLAKVAPADTTPLPAATKAGDAPAQVNDIARSAQPVNTVDQSTTASGKKKKKNPKPKFTSGEESSSTHKKKKGLHKLY
jgi:outer membrane protein assembly factor BamD